MNSYQILTSSGVGRYDVGGWHPVTLFRCVLCGTILAEDGFLFAATDDSSTSFRDFHTTTCFGDEEALSKE